jgi:hypothetical protein
MKAAAKRKMEFEKLQERKIQTEREKEGDLWSDKEVFVTSAYRKKMEGKSVKITWTIRLSSQFWDGITLVIHKEKT